ncbi:D-arabinono-1,4-lactone oxidase [Geosmithia morbida]|uniref:D-arabinono-1,4-lactone oxidase n=1 Tax=Geosmithia morbida TaxID=1094350 RepID=A0A9P4YZ82_9HYPO|nr:D-arabinono-1,4-lactone oxidase [Geosmithia morbida]KAF4124492.1 D-arabinono-1,4-lactone oxidase [Geosmithia morbida]
MDPLVSAELARRSADGVAFRAQAQHTHRTWARTFSSLPELYIRPRTLAEVEKAVDVARACRRRIATVGCGHSPSSMTCTSSWLVNLDDFDAVHSVDRETGLAVVDGGIRLYRLCEELDRRGLAMPNLGSINEQSIAGAISTGTHGSSLRHGLMSEDVVALKVTLASGKTVDCSADRDRDLFRAATLSLGALGIVTQVTIRAVPAFSLRWTQTVDSDARLLDSWRRGQLWSRAEFVRVYWYPYTRRAAVWAADKADPGEAHVAPAANWFDGALGYYVYHNLLALAHLVPRILPWVERLVFGMQLGFRDGVTTPTAVEPGSRALLLNCLYSQFVNEWAIPLERGPEALARLSSWLNRLDESDDGYVEHGIPFSAEGLYVHAPVEVRVSDGNRPRADGESPVRPFLDPTSPDGPTLYLNATLYRPYHLDPPCRERYYRGFEHLMRDLGGRPHWAKNFDARRPEIEAMFGQDLDEWRVVRDRADPDGMFVGPWHRERVMAEGPRLPLEEVEVRRAKVGDGSFQTVGELP